MHQESNENFAEVFAALASPIRLNIIQNVLQAQAENVELNLQDAVYPYKLVRASINHHIKLLVNTGILAREKKGREVHLRFVPESFESVRNFLLA